MSKRVVKVLDKYIPITFHNILCPCYCVDTLYYDITVIYTKNPINFHQKYNNFMNKCTCNTYMTPY